MMKKKVILFLTMPQDSCDLDSVKEYLETKKSQDNSCTPDSSAKAHSGAVPACADFAIYPIYIEKEQWEQKLVPWEKDVQSAPKESAAGGAKAFLTEICSSKIPEICGELGLEKEDVEFIIAGYSLAGLFSLWSLYETEVFAAAVSCSGSLWYPHFKEFVLEKELKRKCRIYLSLGTKEEKSGSRQMRTVGEATREIYAHLQQNQMVEKVVLEWNPGNHFTDVGGRMMKGFAWVLREVSADS